MCVGVAVYLLGWLCVCRAGCVSVGVAVIHRQSDSRPNDITPNDLTPNDITPNNITPNDITPNNITPNDT